MARPKVLFVRYMPYTTTLNRARQFRALGWEPHIIYTSSPANSDMFIQMGRVFEGVWQSEHVEKSFDSKSEFVHSKGFDLLYTIGPPDWLNCQFAGVQCPWIHDFRDSVFLVDPQADDPAELIKQRAITAENRNESFTCEQSADLCIYVTPWQRTKNAKFITDRGAEPTSSIWLPNVPFILPNLNARQRGDVVKFGYTGSIAAAWQNASTFFGQISAELNKLDVKHEFHFWSYMQAVAGKRADWYVQHDTLEQHAMIADMAEHIDYGIVVPPTKSDGMNGRTGWPGKIGDYVAAGIPTFVPSTFMIRETLKKKGWGWAYDNPADIARIMASKRNPTEPRQPALFLKHPDFMALLESGIHHAMQNFETRKNAAVSIAVAEPKRRLLVASDMNQYHAEKHIAPILGSDYSRVLGADIDFEKYKDLYLVGLWPRSTVELEEYIRFVKRFRRVVFHWAGSDVIRAKDKLPPELLREFYTQPNMVHIGQHKGITTEVKKYFNVDAEVLNTPSSYVYESPFKLPKRFAVSVYYPPFKESRGLYGLDMVDRVIKEMPDVLFYLHSPTPITGEVPKGPNVKVLDPINPIQYPEFLKHVSVFLRLTEHDGVPYSMVEHICAGRYCVMQQDFPFTKTVKRDVADVVAGISEFRSQREPNMAGANYWRGYNDFDRFRNNVDRLLTKSMGVEEQAVAETSA